MYTSTTLHYIASHFSILHNLHYPLLSPFITPWSSTLHHYSLEGTWFLHSHSLLPPFFFFFFIFIFSRKKSVVRKSLLIFNSQSASILPLYNFNYQNLIWGNFPHLNLILNSSLLSSVDSSSLCPFPYHTCNSTE